MSAVHEFYEWYDREIASTQTTRRRGRKPNDRQYFTHVTEQAIIAYNKEENQILRNKIYKEHIDYPFNKLVENIYHTFKFSYFDIPYEDIKCEVVAFLIEKIDRYTEGKGKAFSYFSIIAKNYLIIQNNTNYSKLKRRAEPIEIDDNRDLINEVSLNNYQESLRDFVTQWCAWYDLNINRVFTNKRDILVADTILELFRTVDHIENFNKKAIYILIRERTDLKTQNITKVLNVLRLDFERMFKRYSETGHIVY